MNQKDLLNEIGQIRSLMERSSKFMSISGLSGVLIGCIALIGACLAFYFVSQGSMMALEGKYNGGTLYEKDIIWELVILAIVVLMVSIFTGIFMAKSKAKRSGQNIWNPASKSMAKAMAIPLFTGGVFTLFLISSGNFSFIASSLLIFYGLALSTASIYTFTEVRYLGLFEIALGLIALVIPEYGIWFWAVGFGVLHIVYGIIVHKRYEK